MLVVKTPFTNTYTNRKPYTPPQYLSTHTVYIYIYIAILVYIKIKVIWYNVHSNQNISAH